MEIKVLVKAWFTKEAKNPMPMRTMVGKVLKETKNAYLLSLHGQPEPSTTCLHCNRKLTHPVSVLYGIGPVCGQHFHINPLSSEEELMERMAEIKSKLEAVTWEGWVPKSQIISFELLASPKRYQVEFLYKGQKYRTIADEDNLGKIKTNADQIYYVIDTHEEAI